MTDQNADRLPPQNPKAEDTLLGLMLRENEIVPEVCQVVSAAHFYAHHRQIIFRTIVKLVEEGKTADCVSLAETLKFQGELDELGPQPYVVIGTLWGMLQSDFLSLDYGICARAVKDAAIQRALIRASSEISQSAWENKAEPSVIVEGAELIFREMSEQNSTSNVMPMTSALAAATDYIDRRQQNVTADGVPSGFIDLDEATGGFHDGELIILAARPSVGKTALACNIAVNAASKGMPFFFASLEQSAAELGMRWLASEARVDCSSARRGRIAAHDVNALLEAQERLYPFKGFIDDTAGQQLMRICSQARRLKQQHDIRLVIVDYLQLINSERQRGESREQQVAAMSKRLKQLARELRVPVIALAQLNRQVENRGEEKPKLSDLRDCLCGDSKILNADTGELVAVKDIVEKGMRFDVLGVDEDWKVARKPICAAWRVGTRPTKIVTTESGRKICCTDGHRFLSENGWKELRAIGDGECIAAPRSYLLWGRQVMSEDRALLLGALLVNAHLGGTATLSCKEEDATVFAKIANAEFGLNPSVKPDNGGKVVRLTMTTGRMSGAGQNPLTTWLREIGAWGKTAIDKDVPACIFRQPGGIIAAFLRGLFHTDGTCPVEKNGRCRVAKFTSISESLAKGVFHLLCRLGIQSVLAKERHGRHAGYPTSHEWIHVVRIGDRNQLGRFLYTVGFMGSKQARATSAFAHKTNDAGHHDRLPKFASRHVAAIKEAKGLSHADIGWRDQGKAMSRDTAVKVGLKLEDDKLVKWGMSDIIWDRIVSIEEGGERDVFDITVEDVHNFFADDIVCHNSGSIEQDADTVLMLWRPEGRESSVVELLIEKQRNGPTCPIRFVFLKQFTRFENFAMPIPVGYNP